MKKVILILGLLSPALSFGQIYQDPDGIWRDHMQGNGYQFRDEAGLDAGHMERNAQGGWTFYDRFGRIIGSADGGDDK